MKESEGHIEWGRRLLGALEKEKGHVPSGVGEGYEGGMIVAILVSLLSTVLLVLLVVMCVCRNGSDDEAKLKNVKKKTSNSNLKQSTSQDNKEPMLTDVVIRSKPDTTEENGRPPSNDVNHLNAVPSRQSQISTTSSCQIRPTSLRELPQLPDNPVAIDNQTRLRTSQISDDYDHLGDEENKPLPLPENYDHINLESPPDISEASASDQNSESYYAQVSETSHGAAVPSSRQNIQKTFNDPPYSQVKDFDSYPGEKGEPPYNRVMDDPPYNVVTDPYNTVSDEPPYNTVKDDLNDPYNRIADPYSVPQDVGAVGGQGESLYELDPDGEDPYTLVDNEDLKVKVVSISRSSGLSHSGDPFHVSGLESITDEMMPIINAGFGASNEAAEVSTDDYAVVQKDRNASTSSEPELLHASNRGASSSVVPPEPPRAYGAHEIEGISHRQGSSPSRILVAPHLPLPAAPDTSITPNNRHYSKVTARESLASMSARHALNPYEVVLDNENTYATVDGGSGDGIVTNPAPAPPSSPLPPISDRVPVVNHNDRQVVYRQPSETYAEIGASAGGATSNIVPSAPDPPSLDSLHSMKKHERRHLATPEDTSLDEHVSTSPSKRSSFSPTTALPGIPIVKSKSLQSDLTLDSNYQTVKDSIVYADAENDPNYESVEDAKAKFPKSKQTQHFYEEVSPTTSQQTSPNNARTRVLNKHTYEDINEIKEHKKRMSKGDKK